MPHHRVLILLVVVVCAITGALAIAGRSDAQIIAPAGPWPAPVQGAVNPLLGTPFTANGVNPGPPQSSQVRVWFPGGRTDITRKLGRGLTLHGDVVNTFLSGGRVTGALVQIVAQYAVAPAPGSPPFEWNVIAVAYTDQRGRFRVRLGADWHRRIAALYWPAVDWTTPLYSGRLLARVRARVWLGRPLRKGRAFRFDGRVSVQFPGLIVALQVRNTQGRWVTTRFGHTTADGRVRIRARFPAGHRFPVRLYVPSQPGMGVFAGRSNPRRISTR